MIYKEKSFCGYYKDCLTPCHRSLTPEVEEEAAELGMYIIEFPTKPICWRTRAHTNTRLHIK